MEESIFALKSGDFKQKKRKNTVLKLGRNVKKMLEIEPWLRNYKKQSRRKGPNELFFVKIL